MGLLVQVEADIFAFILCGILYYDHKKRNQESITKDFFKVILLSVCLISVLESISWLLEERKFIGSHYIYFGVVELLYFVQMIPFAYFFLYILKVLDIRISKFIFSIPLITGIVAVIVNIFSNELFSIDEANVYSRGDLFWVVIAIPFIYAGVAISYVIYHFISGDTENREMFKHFIVIFICGMLGAVLQFTTYGKSYLWGCFSVGMLYIYMNVQSGLNVELQNKYKKLKKKHHKMEEENENILSRARMLTKRLSDMFFVVCYIDLETDYYETIKIEDYADQLIKKCQTAQDALNLATIKTTCEEYVPKMLEFANFQNIQQRLESEDVIVQEFKEKYVGWCEALFLAVERGDSGKVKSVFYLVRVIDSDKKKKLEIEENYRRTAEELQRVMENTNVIYSEMLEMQETGVVAMIPYSGEIIYMNRAAKDIYEVDKEDYEYEFKNMWSKLKSDKKEEIYRNIKAMSKPGDSYGYEAIVEGKNKRTDVLSNAKIIRLSNGKNIGVITIVDITKIKEMEREITRISETDALTGINNRGCGQKKIEELLKNKENGVFALIDCDKFKMINDTYGHIAGDKVLIAIANTMKESFKDDAVLLRLGGDEFAFFLPKVIDRNKVQDKIEMLFNNVDSIEIDEIENKKLSISLGAVIYNDRKEVEFDEIYVAADKCLYESKKQFGNYYMICKDEM